MKKQIRQMAAVLSVLLLLSGCGNDSTAVTEDTTTDVSGAAGDIAQTALNVEDMFTDRDSETDYEEDGSARITLDGDSAQCSSDAVEIDGSTVTITDEGVYILSGTLDDGMIIVNAENTDKLQLVLEDASIHSETSAAIYILQADKVFLTTATDTENTVSNGGEFTAIDENNIDAVIFSKEDLTLNGEGSLSIVSPAGHGVVSKDDLVITSGSYTIDAASHGFDGKDSVRIADGSFDITAGKDGIHAENEDDTSLGYVYIADGAFSITAEGDGVSASAAMQIDDGTFVVTAGGGSENGSSASSDYYGWSMGGRGGGQRQQSAETDSTDDSTSMKGFKATGNLLICGGSFTVDAADDGIHSNASIAVSGGSFEIATGDDGFHADETLAVSAGTIAITESYEGLEGLTIEISGGEISVVATDDGFNAAGGTDESGMGGRDGQYGGWGGSTSSSNGSIVISDGTISIQASGDGIDSNGGLEITGGYTVVCGPTQGDTATLDYDTTAVISGGTFIGTGASGMAQTFSSSEQGVIAVSTGTQSAGTSIVLQDAAGNVIMEVEPALDFAVAILSSEEIESGETYTLVIGTSSAEVEAD